MSARGQLGRVFYQRSGGPRTAVGRPAASGADVQRLAPGDRVWIVSGARASAVIVYAGTGIRVQLGPGGRHTVRRPPTASHAGARSVVGQAVRALIAVLGRRADAPASGVRVGHDTSRGPEEPPVLVLPDAHRPWSVLPGSDPLTWAGEVVRHAGDRVRLWSGTSEPGCAGGTLASDEPLAPGSGGLSTSRPVYDRRAALLPGTHYRLELVSARGETRAAGCVRTAPPADAEATVQATEALVEALAGPLPKADAPQHSTGRWDAEQGGGVLAAALLAERGFVPDALLLLDRALALDPEDWGAVRLQDAIRASALAP